MEDAEKSQRAIIFFLWKEGVKSSEIVQRLQAVFGDAAESKSTVYRWIDRFKNGRTTLKDDQRIGRPKTTVTEKNIAAVEKLVTGDRHVSIREISKSTSIGIRQVHEILHKHLGLNKKTNRKTEQRKCDRI